MNRPSALPILLALCAQLAGPALAQNNSQNSPQANKISREQLPKEEQKTAPGEQKIERIRTEDSAVRIDELRVGGQTQSIDVQPKGNAPAYQVSPEAGGNANPAQRDAPASTKGVRSWKILNF